MVKQLACLRSKKLMTGEYPAFIFFFTKKRENTFVLLK